MKKDLEELTQEELIELSTEITRMFTFGSVSLLVAAKNSGNSPKGWPTVNVEDLEVSLCHILDVILDYNAEDAAKSLGALASMLEPVEVAKLAVHQAMHDAFCLGVASVTLMEMDFSGLEDALDELRNVE